MLKIHNSQSQQLEDFKPQSSDTIRMYVCGPTVYGPAHLGNARPAIVFDTLYRLMVHHYPSHTVKYGRNVTDVDDKIITAANDRDVAISEITSDALARYHSDLNSLHCLSPTIEPKATENIPSMIEMIQRLIEQDHAYEVEGEVFFSVSSNPYPGLANHKQTNAGARVEVDPNKRDPRDFVLWKPAKPGEPNWSSPWGEGRPGWHIECSAMISNHLGTTIDIHGGGSDLRFPHHEAEAAQSQCAHEGAPLANYWMHNGLLTVDGKKMSKSLGNVIMLEDLLKRFPGESIRYHFLKTHYRSPMDFTGRGMKTSHRALEGLYDTLHEFGEVEAEGDAALPAFFYDKLLDDLNTPAAISNLHKIAKTLEEKPNKEYWKGALINAGKLLGFFNHSVDEWFHRDIDTQEVERLLAERNAARDQRDWARADLIRTKLAEMGVTVADGTQGTRWRKT